MNLEERVTHSLRHSAAPHSSGEACPHGAKPAGHVCLPPHIHLGWFFVFFCHQYPELLVASYNNNEDAPHEPDGVALVWNMKYKKATPEYVFHCQVLKAKPLCLFPPTPSTHPHRWPLSWQARSTANHPSLLLLLYTPHPPAFIHIVSSPYWHSPSPHLSTTTC